MKKTVCLETTIPSYYFEEREELRYQNLIKDIPTLSIPDEIRDIVEVYLKNYVMPRKDIGDAFHLAIASYYKIDYLLTWNCDHLANINKEEHIKIVNERIGISTPRITTPLQLFIEEAENV